MPARSYAQHCALARALDRVGDRWTLLIIRELLVSPRRWTQLRAGLPGMASNLLAARLVSLEADGLICRRADGTAAVYELTDVGAALGEPVSALVRWGARWMGERTESDVLQPHWLVVALRALVEPAGAGLTLRAGGVDIALADGDVALGVAPHGPTLETDPETALGLAAGRLALEGAMREGRATLRPSDAASLRRAAAALGA